MSIRHNNISGKGLGISPWPEKTASMQSCTDFSPRSSIINSATPRNYALHLPLLARTLALIGLNFLYAVTSIFTKMASKYGWGSRTWMAWMAGAVATMGLYALLWQQALRRVPVATAYVFRGTALLFVLLISHFLFGEPVTARNLIGAGLIVGGIALYAGA